MKFVHGYYSRSEALKNGWYEAKTRRGGTVRVTAFNVLRAPEERDVRYSGLIRTTGLKPMGKLASRNPNVRSIDVS